MIGALSVVAFLTIALPSLAATTRTSNRSSSMPRAAAPSWPPGTTVVPFELRDGLILVRTTLHPPSGRDASGLFVFDTGAPGLVVTASVWYAMQLDTIGREGSKMIAMRRPLEAVDLGGARMTNLSVDGVIPDGVLDPEFLGLIGPSLLGDRAIVVDYVARKLAIVNRSLTLMSRDTSSSGTVDRASIERVRRSRARYGAILPAQAVAVPFRMFRGGRMLVTARVEETSPAWRSEPLTLLMDTGASACAIFADAADPRVSHMGRWPTLRDRRFRTVLGESRMDLVLLPRLTLPVATGLVSERGVEAGLTERHSLPDLQGELPDPVHGLLGYSFFRRFRLVLDYPDEVLWLTPATSTPERATATIEAMPSTPTAVPAATGIVLGSLWGKTTVAAVMPGTPAAASGAHPGDMVVSIDGKAVTGMDPEDAQRLLDGGTGTAVVVVRREGMQQVLRLSRQRRR